MKIENTPDFNLEIYYYCYFEKRMLSMKINYGNNLEIFNIFSFFIFLRVSHLQRHKFEFLRFFFSFFSFAFASVFFRLIHTAEQIVIFYRKNCCDYSHYSLSNKFETCGSYAMNWAMEWAVYCVLPRFFAFSFNMKVEIY